MTRLWGSPQTLQYQLFSFLLLLLLKAENGGGDSAEREGCLVGASRNLNLKEGELRRDGGEECVMVR